MRDLLPDQVFEFLRDRYIAGVATAEANFVASRADEDALTGALGQALAMPTPWIFTGPDGDYAVQVSYRKLRGRGLNAPERLYGSDGLFQIEVSAPDGSVLRRKGLPFQSKTNWRGRSASVASQAADIQASTGEGLVIDYASTGYRACKTGMAIETRGNRREVERRGGMAALGQILGNDFLECRVGRVGLFYDTLAERYYEGPRLISPRHAVTTRVSRLDVPD